MKSLFEIAQKEIETLNKNCYPGANDFSVYSFAINLEKNEITLYAEFSYDLCTQAYHGNYSLQDIGYLGSESAVYYNEIEGIDIKLIAYRNKPGK
jgi:hypothetical protein